MIDVEILTEISQKVFSEHSQVLVYSSKIIAASVFVVASIKTFTTEFTKRGSVDNDQKTGFNSYFVIRSLILLALIGSIPELLTLLDKMLSGMLDLFVKDFDNDLYALEMQKLPIPEATEEDSVVNSILKLILDFKEYFSITGGIARAVNYIAYIIDVLIFMIFLGKRFFALGVIKLISPLMVAFSIFPKYQELVYNIGKIYARTFLTIIPLLLVNVFANEFYRLFIEYMTGSSSATGVMIMAGDFVKTVAQVGFIWMKLKLFKYSTELMHSLWP